MRIVADNNTAVNLGNGQQGNVLSVGSGVHNKGEVAVKPNSFLKLGATAFADLPPPGSCTCCVAVTQTSQYGLTPIFSNGNAWINLYTGTPVEA